MSVMRHLQETPVPCAEVRAQAAAWVARLQDGQRNPELEARLDAWLAESEEHRRAFRRMNQTWEQAGLIRMRAGGDLALTSGSRLRRANWAAIAAAVVLAVVAAVYFERGNAVTTGVGQQGVRTLPDGTRVVLNTDTRIEVAYDSHARRVHLIRGEAWFEVSHRPSWPFLVSAAGEEIRALGTSFIVRHDDIHDMSVTLIEGQISVTSVRSEEPASPPEILSPGQRLRISPHHAPAVDRPEMTRVTAWRHGQVEFEQTPLGDAVKEMNRYSTTHLVADAGVANLRIGGVFRAGDAEDFARIVTAALDLRSERSDGGIVLSKPPDVPPVR